MSSTRKTRSSPSSKLARILEDVYRKCNFKHNSKILNRVYRGDFNTSNDFVDYIEEILSKEDADVARRVLQNMDQKTIKQLEEQIERENNRQNMENDEHLKSNIKKNKQKKENTKNSKNIKQDESKKITFKRKAKRRQLNKKLNKNVMSNEEDEKYSHRESQEVKYPRVEEKYPRIESDDSSIEDEVLIDKKVDVNKKLKKEGRTKRRKRKVEEMNEEESTEKKTKKGKKRKNEKERESPPKKKKYEEKESEEEEEILPKKEKTHKPKKETKDEEGTQKSTKASKKRVPKKEKDEEKKSEKEKDEEEKLKKEKKEEKKSKKKNEKKKNKEEKLKKEEDAKTMKKPKKVKKKSETKEEKTKKEEKPIENTMEEPKTPEKKNDKPKFQPRQIGEIFLLNLGKLYTGKNSNKYIRKQKGKVLHPYTIGYSIRRDLLDFKDCILSVKEGEKGPIFEISTTDGKSFEGNSPTTACRELYNFVNLKFSQNGQDVFGFNNQEIQKLLKDLYEQPIVTILDSPKNPPLKSALKSPEKRSSIPKRVQFSPDVNFDSEKDIQCPICGRYSSKYQINTHLKLKHFTKDVKENKRKKRILEKILNKSSK